MRSVPELGTAWISIKLGRSDEHGSGKEISSILKSSDIEAQGSISGHHFVANHKAAPLLVRDLQFLTCSTWLQIRTSRESSRFSHCCFAPELGVGMLGK